MITITNLTKEYRIKNSKSILVLKNLNIEFPDRGIIALLGKSGSGKTTLLNLIGGLIKPTSGTIEYKGINYNELSKSDYDNLRNDHCGFIFQENYLIPELSVYDNVRLALNIQNVASEDINQKIIDALSKLDILDLKDKLINDLSGGEKQRVSIARVIAKGCKFILADEPTGSLDEESADNVFQILKKISNDCLVILVTHSKEDAFLYADRVITLKYGQIVEDSGISIPIKAKESRKEDLFKNHKDMNLLTLLKLSNKILNRKLKRLIFTIIFWVFSLSMFMFLGTFLTINKEKLALDSFNENNINHIKIVTESFYNGSVDLNNTTFTDDELKEFPNLEFNKFYTPTNNLYVLQDFSKEKLTKYENTLYNIFYTQSTSSAKEQFDYLPAFDMIEVVDYLPLQKYKDIELNKNDIYITDFMASKFIYYKLFDKKTVNDLIGEKLIYKNGTELIIKGLIDTDYEKYLTDYYFRYNDGTPKFLDDSTFMHKARNDYSTIYLNNETLDLISEIPDTLYTKIDENLVTIEKVDPFMDELSYYGELPANNNEIIVTPQFLSIFFEINYAEFDENIDLYINKEIDFSFLSRTNDLNSSVKKYKIVGIYYNNGFNLKLNIDEYMLVAKELNISSRNKLIEGIAVNLGNESDNLGLIKKINDNNFVIYNYLMNELNSANRLIEDAKDTIFNISMVFLIFLILIIYYFVSSLISGNSRLIGILTSLGSSKRDIIKLFLFELIKMFIISMFISTIVNIIYIFYINDKLSFVFQNIRFIKFSLLTLIIVFIFGLFIAMASCFLPFNKLRKKDITDIIYDK